MFGTFGCVRWVYNTALANRETLYRETGKGSTYNRDAKLLTEWKREAPWLSEVSAVPLQQALRHLQTAYAGFFAIPRPETNSCSGLTGPASAGIIDRDSQPPEVVLLWNSGSPNDRPLT
ncbi:MAG: helix-turn-helix domain-containing protein [Bacillota bacterium]